jgi:hypothetical protein
MKLCSADTDTDTTEITNHSSTNLSNSELNIYVYTAISLKEILKIYARERDIRPLLV